jgi:glycosyltransferase involved in cell wall biosynthesis
MGRVVREEGVGTVCDPDDPQSIAAAVRAIIDDPDAEARFRAATRVAITRYNWDHEEQKLLTLYRRLEPAAG